MKLVVCGCSWSAVSVLKDYKGSHFSELLANDLGAELFNFALGGASNFGIRLQLDEAIKIKPDLVIITPTYPDRIELPTDNKSISNDISLADIYNPWIHKNLNKALIRTRTINDLIEKNYQYIKEYVAYYYQPAAKTVTDRWIIRDGITQLKQAEIKFLIQPQLLWTDHFSAHSFLGAIVPQKNIIGNDICIFDNLVDSDSNFDPGFHTSLETQQLFSNRLQILIKEIL